MGLRELDYTRNLVTPKRCRNRRGFGMASGVPRSGGLQNLRVAVLRPQSPNIDPPGEILTPQSDAVPESEENLDRSPKFI
jgi:hypothetical protein